MPLKAIASLAVFGGELIANPRPVGAAVPSSRSLAKRMADLLPLDPPGYVVELGAGTGAITEALLERGISPDRIIPIEISAGMTRHLRHRFPGLNVLQGNAARLSGLLRKHLDFDKETVSHIVSSLPLRSLAPEDVTRIMREVKRVLAKDGCLIQYTYDLRRGMHPALAGFARVTTSVVWFNLPPARVDVFRAIRKNSDANSSR